MSEARVLIIEDEPAMRRLLRASLASKGFRVVEAATAKEALSLAPGHNPELVLLDLGLPDADGIEVTRRLREWTAAPIIVLSARGREDDKVAALDAGADDYLTKPFGMNELIARMRVALRHASAAAVSPRQQLDLGAVRIDFTRREITKDGELVKLTPIEYRLFALLASHAGLVLTHQQILKEVWGPGHSSETHYLRVYMAQLRRKLEADPARPRLLVTEPGVGYRLREP
jgi:two-component system KDP operon response regulator KdpE